MQTSVHQGRVELRRIDRATDPASLGQAVEDLPVALDETAHAAHELLVVSNPVDFGLKRVEDQLVEAHTASTSEDQEALGRVDLLDGLTAIAIDEVKYKKGHKYLTVVCDHVTGQVVWATDGRSKTTVGAFFDALGDRAADLEFVTADGAAWIRDVVAARAPDAIVCLDTFHIVSWAIDALDQVRREEWNKLRAAGAAHAAKEFKGLRFLLRRNWENLTMGQRETLWALETANRRTFRALELKEGLRDIFALPLLQAQRALDAWLAYASRSKLAPFVKLARTIRAYRASIEATIEWKLTNGIAESNNASIGRIRTNARGFHTAEAFITMIMLDRAGLAPQLPWLNAA